MSETTSDPVLQARVDLVSALRWADRIGLGEGICNHFSLLVPGTTDRFLLNPQGIHWSEVTVSDLLIVDPDGNLVEGRHRAEPTAFFIHSRIHLNRPSAKCVLHTHMPYATALCCLQQGRVEMCSQGALRYYNRIAYDDDYRGLALDQAEGDRICASLAEADALFLSNHGVIMTGEDVACAFDDLYYLERACMHQVLAQSAGQPLKLIPDDICRVACGQLAAERQQSYLFLEAIKRILKRESPEYLK